MLNINRKPSKLEAWFQLNLSDNNANGLLYTDIPNNYVFDNKQNIWKIRQRGKDKIISRMYAVSLKDEERFYLRLLLLHVRGATSYDFLRIFNDVQYPTFKAAAAARGLLSSDEEWDRCLREATAFQMPRQLRETLAFICIFGEPANASQL